MTTKQVLQKALNLIKKGWTQGAYARNKHGRGVNAFSKSACRFCADGALMRAAEQNMSNYSEAAMFLSKFCDDGHIHYNDTHTKAEVIAAFQAAIRSC